MTPLNLEIYFIGLSDSVSLTFIYYITVHSHNGFFWVKRILSESWNGSFRRSVGMCSDYFKKFPKSVRERHDGTFQLSFLSSDLCVEVKAVVFVDF